MAREYIGRLVLMAAPLDQVRSAVSSYRAPTFSWASIEGEIWFPQYNPENFEQQSLLVNGRCSSKELNVFGAVTEGFISLHGPVIQATLSCKRPKSLTRYNLRLGKSPQHIETIVDVPLTRVDVTTTTGGTKQTVQRACTGKAKGFEWTPIWCLNLVSSCNNEREFIGLLLGESTTKPGCYERLGVLISAYCSFPRMEWTGDVSSWLAGASKATITIV
jgi:hypothetical protein